jgi:hypothetical protein
VLPDPHDKGDEWYEEVVAVIMRDCERLERGDGDSEKEVLEWRMFWWSCFAFFEKEWVFNNMVGKAGYTS